MNFCSIARSVARGKAGPLAFCKALIQREEFPPPACCATVAASCKRQPAIQPMQLIQVLLLLWPEINKMHLVTLRLTCKGRTPSRDPGPSGPERAILRSPGASQPKSTPIQRKPQAHAHSPGNPGRPIRWRLRRCPFSSAISSTTHAPLCRGEDVIAPRVDFPPHVAKQPC